MRRTFTQMRPAWRKRFLEGNVADLGAAMVEFAIKL